MKVPQMLKKLAKAGSPRFRLNEPFADACIEMKVPAQPASSRQINCSTMPRFTSASVRCLYEVSPGVAATSSGMAPGFLMNYH